MSDTLKHFLSTLADPRTWPGGAAYAVLLFIFAIIASRVIRVLATRALARGRVHHLDRAVVQFLTQFAQVLVWIGVVMVFLHIVPALQKLGTALLTGVSVASVVIGLAAQTTLSNFIAGFSLILYRPFEVDDVITITGPGGQAMVGVIEQLSLGYTILRTSDDRRIVMPNNVIANQVAVSSNHAQLRNMAIVSAILPKGKGTERVKQFLLGAAKNHPAVINVISCLDLALPDGGISLSLRVWCRSPAAAEAVPRDIISIVREKASAEGIDILLSNVPEPPDKTGALSKS
jgi:small-conductance mechanosensitive channel